MDHEDGFLHDDSCRVCRNHRNAMRSEREVPLAWRLVEANHRPLYLANAWFHYSVDLLAQFLPALIDGLAAQANDHPPIELRTDPANPFMTLPLGGGHGAKP